MMYNIASLSIGAIVYTIALLPIGAMLYNIALLPIRDLLYKIALLPVGATLSNRCLEPIQLHNLIPPTNTSSYLPLLPFLILGNHHAHGFLNMTT